jgi:hypothetical protein
MLNIHLIINFLIQRFLHKVEMTEGEVEMTALVFVLDCHVGVPPRKDREMRPVAKTNNVSSRACRPRAALAIAVAQRSRDSSLAAASGMTAGRFLHS